MKIINFLILIFAFTTIVSCNQKEDFDTINMRVNSTTAYCTGVSENSSCLLVQINDSIGSDNWDLFYFENSIQGFNYEPGFIYDLSVKVIPISNPPADGSSLKYELLEIFSKIADSTESCQTEVVIDNEKINNPENISTYTINSAEIINNCLHISFSSSGCDSDTWQFELIGSEDVLESYPPQRRIKFTLDNQDECLAFFNVDVTFDISQLKVEGNELILHLDEWDEPLIYQY
ncbi:DUF4377 domain-containing protein [Urechidicola croceus]|uniref:DUF4377 domain-containing protein n=1 Tax=Urechidicola croceus TaxID=1850246 RepID=A0A1D8P538_9FLAO|nr:DUF4377 domain-containing protein [Urechidicola croceus]AOW19690.1 hypothetical protein LPB138_02885 [Urechidicola croceus]